MNHGGMSEEMERFADLLAKEFESDVKRTMSFLGDKPLFSTEMTPQEKRQKATEVANDPAYWAEAIKSYGFANAFKAQSEMLELLRGQP